MNNFTIIRGNGDISFSLQFPQTYIYRFLCIPTGKSYIGRTNSPTRRIQEHLDGSGSQLLLKSLVDYGINNFTIELLDSSNAQTLLDTIEDYYIDKFDSLHPNGFNLRMNLPIVKNDSAVDLRLFAIEAKFVFKRNHKSYFTIGELTQARSYQVLTNFIAIIGVNHNLKKKKNNIFRYFEIALHSDITYNVDEIYHITLSYYSVEDEFEIVI